jgi:hypothetical protein
MFARALSFHCDPPIFQLNMTLAWTQYNVSQKIAPLHFSFKALKFWTSVLGKTVIKKSIHY